MDAAAKTLIATGDYGLIASALLVSCSVILVLAGLAVYQYKTRVSMQQRVVDSVVDSQRALHQKIELVDGKLANVQTAQSFIQQSTQHFLDTNEKRLAAGADKMKLLEDQITRLKESSIAEMGKVVTESKFESYCERHQELHQDMDRRLQLLRDGQMEVKSEIRALSSGLGGRLDALAKILSGKVVVDDTNT